MVGAAEIVPGEERIRCQTDSLDEARGMVVRGVERALPVVLVVSETAADRTAVLKAVAQALITRGPVVLLRGGAVTLESIVTRFLAALGAPVAEQPMALQLRLLTDHLLARRHDGSPMALLIDDADRIDVHVLTALRLLLGSEPDGSAVLPIVLGGTTALRDHLGRASASLLGPHAMLDIEVVSTPEGTRSPSVPTTAVTIPRVSSGPWRTWRIAAASAFVLVALAALMGQYVRRWEPIDRPPRVAAVSLPAGRASLFIPPDRSHRDAVGTPLSADDARYVVNAFRRAVANADVVTLRSLLAADAEQNAVRGRESILATYAYRFDRIDVDTEILAPQRIILRGDEAIVHAPFVAWYRDAAGRPGTLGGQTSWRIIRLDGRPVVASLDYEYALASEQ